MMLGEFLKRPAQPWAWGASDCCTWVADWIMAHGHADPMGFIRGRYANEVGALRAIRRGGGLVALWQRGADDAGLAAVPAPVAGDIGVLAIPTDDGLGQACGIWTGQRWITRHQAGLIAGHGGPLKIWRGAWAR